MGNARQPVSALSSTSAEDVSEPRCACAFPRAFHSLFPSSLCASFPWHFGFHLPRSVRSALPVPSVPASAPASALACSLATHPPTALQPGGRAGGAKASQEAPAGQGQGKSSGAGSARGLEGRVKAESRARGRKAAPGTTGSKGGGDGDGATQCYSPCWSWGSAFKTCYLKIKRDCPKCLWAA